VARDIAFQKIESRVKGTAMASEQLGIAETTIADAAGRD